MSGTDQKAKGYSEVAKAILLAWSVFAPDQLSAFKPFFLTQVCFFPVSIVESPRACISSWKGKLALEEEPGFKSGSTFTSCVIFGKLLKSPLLFICKLGC